MPETVQTFAQRVKEKDPSYRGMDDARVVYDVLNESPVYRQRFLPQERRNNIFGTIFREALLGFAETGSKTVEGIGFNLASMIASETMTEEEFNQSDKAGTMSYQDYKEHNDERVEVENKAIAHAQNVGDFFKNLTPEDTAGPQGTFETLVGQVARGLGQFAGYAAAGTAVTAAGTALGSPVGGAAAATASIYTIATMNRQMEFIDDAERTLGKNITEMSADEKDKITKGSLGYGAITGALDATVFKYVAGMPNALKSVLQKAKIGKPVSEKLFKSALAQASSNALKRGAAEGLQESIGDGMTLDIMAKNLYDEERKFITGDALGRRIMEFTVGGLVGGIGSGIGDSGKLLQGKAITPEGQQRLNDETDRILEAMPSVDREKIAKAILDGDPNPEITVFDLNGTPVNVKVTSYEQDGKIEVETQDGIKQVLGEGDLVEYNSRSPEYTLQVETETGKPDQKLSDLSSQELDKAIKEREAYAEENAQSEDPMFVQGVNNALGDVFALRAEKRRRARLEREAGRPVEPKQPKKKAKDVDQTGGQTFTVTYVSKESGLKTTTEVVASSLEEAETQFRNLYKDDISRDGAVEVTVKGKPEPAPTEPVPTEPVPTEPVPEPTPEVDYSNVKVGDTIKIYGVTGKESDVEVIGVSDSGTIRFRRKDGSEGIVGLETDSVLFNINSTNYTTQARGTGFGGRKISDMTDAELKELANIIDEKFKSKKIPKDGKEATSLEHLADRNAIKLEQKRRKQKPEPTPPETETTPPEPDVEEGETNLKPKIVKTSAETGGYPLSKITIRGKDIFIGAVDAVGGGRHYHVTDEGGFTFLELDGETKTEDTFLFLPRTRKELIEELKKFYKVGEPTKKAPKKTAPKPEPTTTDRPELDVGTPLDPIPEEKFDEPELSLVEREINEANVIKFITQKFGNIFNSDLLALGGTKLRVKFVSKSPKDSGTIAVYKRVDALFDPNKDQVFSDKDHTIIFYVDKLMEGGDGTRGIIKTVRHELMHAIGRVAAAKKGKSVTKLYEAISKSMTPDQRRLMDELYARKGYQYSSGQHNGRGAEFFRAILEEFGYGTPSEENSRRKEILKKGTAFEKVTQLIKDIQSYIANFFKGDVLTNPEVATLFIDSVNLLAQLDPKARPVNQKLVDLVRSRISPNTDTLYDNVNDYTKNMETFVDEQLAQDDGKKVKHEQVPKDTTAKGMSFASKYLIPVGQVLGNIHSDLEKAFHKYIQIKDEKILIRHRMARPFSEKMKALKKSNEGDYIKLWALIAFSPNATESRYSADEQNQFIEERNTLLKKYGMYNEYLATRKVLDNVMNDALDTGIEIGFLEQYFPRYLNPEGRAGFLKKYAGIDRRTFLGEIDAENKRRANLKATRYVLKLNGEDIGTFGRRSAAATARARRAAELGVTEQDIEIVAMELPAPQPPIEEGSIQEVQFIQKLLNDPKYRGKGKSNFQKQRVIEKISEEDTQYYLDPMQAYSNYITQMTTTIETAKFAGVNQPEANAPSKDRITVEYDPTSELGRLIAKLARENPDPEFQSQLYEYLPQIYRAIMSKGAQEYQVLAWMRQFSYFSLLVEITSTMSQLYDLPFIMYDNGFLNTLRSMIGNKEFNVGDYLDQDRMVEQNFGGDKDAVLMKLTSKGLELTGFRKLDQIMKNTTMDANYKRYMRLARELNLSYLNPDGSIKEEHKNKFNNKQRKFLAELNQFLSPEVTNPNEPMEMLVALRTQPEQRSQRQQDLIKSTLVAKLFQNQPLSELRMPLAVRQDPNMRMWYTMKSFMIVQVNTARNLAFNKIARGLNQAVRTGGKEGVDELREGMVNLLILMGYFVMLGIPVDFVKDIIAGRVGYISDYTFNSMVRVAGVNKYFLYKGRNEGYGTAIMNFAMPAPLAAVIDTGDKMTAAFEKEGSPSEKLFDSGILKQLPLYDTLHYVVPELREYKRERERFFMKRRMRQQEEGFIGLFEKIEPRPRQITRDLLGI